MLSQTGKLFFKIYRQTPNGPLVANTSKNMPWMSWWECQYFTTHDTKMYIQYNFWSTQEDIFRHVICKWVREHFKLQINIHNHPPRFWKKKNNSPLMLTFFCLARWEASKTTTSNTQSSQSESLLTEDVTNVTPTPDAGSGMHGTLPDSHRNPLMVACLHLTINSCGLGKSTSRFDVRSIVYIL